MVSILHNNRITTTMKIGILTLPFHTNYGGVLQAYALQTTIQRMGHEVCVLNINRELKRSMFMRCLSFLKYFANRYLLKREITYKSDRDINKDLIACEIHFRSFISKHINEYCIRKLEKDYPEFVDGFVVGSDQIWRHDFFCKMFNSDISSAFLGFWKKKGKRVAYAPSFGVETWEYSKEEDKICEDLLKRFDYVSVRERSGVDHCNKHLGRYDVVQVLDPTMLLNDSEWSSIIDNAETHENEGDLMCFIFDNSEEKKKIVEGIVQRTDLKPFFSYEYSDNKLERSKDRVYKKVEQWLRGIRDSKVVVTDSYHACVFSIIFGRPFIALAHDRNGEARLLSLFHEFGINKKVVRTIKDIDFATLFQKSDCNQCLTKLRKESLDFLNKSLN